jgi:phosphoribosylglycinamide formyltransferase 1
MTERRARGHDDVFRIAVLASGSGSNLQAIIDQVHRPAFQVVDTEEVAPGHDPLGGDALRGDTPGRDEPGDSPLGPAAGSDGRAVPTAASADLPRMEIVLVVSDIPGARAVERAERAGIRTAVIPARDFKDRVEHDLALATKLCEAEPDLVVLAGYMRIVSPSLLLAFPYRVINLHPALLPAFPGTHSISDAVGYGVKVTGVTVHFVDPGVDTGPIIAQEAVRVEDDDTSETLAARIHEVEHRLLPATIRLIAAGRVKPPLPGSRVVQVDWGANDSTVEE